MISVSLLTRMTYLVLSMVVSSFGATADPARTYLVARSEFWFVWLIGSTIAVGLGVIAEIPECIYELKEWLAHKNQRPFKEKHGRLTVPLAVVGAIVVAVGIAVEGIAEYKGASAETAIRAYDETQTLEAQKQAASAAQSAKDAGESAKEAKSDVKLASEQAESAQNKVNDVAHKAADLTNRLEMLNKDLEVSEQRSVILERKDQFLVDRIAKYSGTRFSVKMCGVYKTHVEPAARDEGEMSSEVRTLMEILTKPEVGWTFVDANLSWKECEDSIDKEQVPGTYVRVSPETNERTKQAAYALSTALEQALPPQSRRVYEGTLGPPDSPEDAPWTLLEKDPNLIVLVVSKQPPAGTKSPVGMPTRK